MQLQVHCLKKQVRRSIIFAKEQFLGPQMDQDDEKGAGSLNSKVLFPPIFLKIKLQIAVLYMILLYVATKQVSVKVISLKRWKSELSVNFH